MVDPDRRDTCMLPGGGRLGAAVGRVAVGGMRSREDEPAAAVA